MTPLLNGTGTYMHLFSFSLWFICIVMSRTTCQLAYLIIISARFEPSSKGRWDLDNQEWGDYFKSGVSWLKSGTICQWGFVMDSSFFTSGAIWCRAICPASTWAYMYILTGDRKIPRMIWGYRDNNLGDPIFFLSLKPYILGKHQSKAKIKIAFQDVIIIWTRKRTCYCIYKSVFPTLTKCTWTSFLKRF